MLSWSSPPMYSIGGAIRGEELKTQSNYYTPGPGTYEHIEEGIVKSAYPTWKMGSSKRQPLYNSTNPEVGPGLYEVAKKDVKKYAKKTFSKDKRGQSEFKGSNAVGPGSYFPKKFMKAPPQFSFGYKGDGFGPANSENIPGPGTYDVKGMFDDADEKFKTNGEPRSAFTRTAPNAMARSRDGENGSAKVPGPGEHYNADIDNYDFRYFAPTWSFGKSTRDELYNDDTKVAPGPGKYNIATALKTKSGFTILGKSQSKGNTNDAPGPNVYNQDINPLRQTAPAFRIGKAERKDMAMENQDVPGPGSYHKVQGLSNKGAKIGSSVRPPLHSLDGKKQPGPGSYDIPGQIGINSKYSMGVKSNSKKPTEVFPGPGEYEPFGTTFFEKTNGAVIGESKRPMLYKHATAPGPGAYDIRGNLGGGTKSRFGTGARAPLAKACDEPGPGYYNIPSAIGNVPKYLLPSYQQEKRRTMTEKDASFKGIFG